jgi:hypothetical protein
MQPRAVTKPSESGKGKGKQHEIEPEVPVLIEALQEGWGMEQMTDALERLATKMEPDDEGVIRDSLVKAFKNSKLDVRELKEFGATLEKIAHRNPKMKGSERALQVSFAAVMVADAADVAYGQTTPKTVNEADWGLLSNRLLRDYTAAVQNEESERSRDSLLLSVKNLARVWALGEFDKFLKELKYFAELPASQNKREEVFRDVWQNSDAKRIKQINSNLARFEDLVRSIRIQLQIDGAFDKSKRDLILRHLDSWEVLRRVVTSGYASPANETNTPMPAVLNAMAFLEEIYRDAEKDSDSSTERADNVESRLTKQIDNGKPSPAGRTPWQRPQRPGTARKVPLIKQSRGPIRRPTASDPTLKAKEFRKAVDDKNIAAMVTMLSELAKLTPEQFALRSKAIRTTMEDDNDLPDPLIVKSLNNLMRAMAQEEFFRPDGNAQLKQLWAAWSALRTVVGILDYVVLDPEVYRSVPEDDLKVARKALGLEQT